MNYLQAEFYERERVNDFHREVDAARLASLVRRSAVRRPTIPGPGAPKGIGRLVVFFRRAAA